MVDIASRILRVTATLALVAWPVGASADSALSNVSGVWSGPVNLRDQRSHVAIRIETTADSLLTIRLSLPAIDVWDLSLGDATFDGDSIRLGWWGFRYNGSQQTMEGHLPTAFVPVYRIPFSLTRTDSLERPSPSAHDAPPIEPVWIHDTGGSVWASVAYWDNHVYVGSDDSTLYALRASTGEVVWRFRTGGAVRAGPTSDGSFLFVHSDDGGVYKLDRGTGRHVWRVQLLDSPRSRVPPGEKGSRYDHYASSATVGDDVVYIGAADGRLYALDMQTGDIRWSVDTGDVIASTPLLHDDRVYFGSFGGNVYAVDAVSGRRLWNYDTGAPVVSTPAVFGDQILIGSRSYDVFALDAASGVPGWTYYYWFSWVESSASVYGSMAYIGSSDAQVLTALDLDRHEPTWQFDTGGSAWARPVVSDAAVFIGSVGVAGYIVDHQAGFFAVDRISGKALWRYEMERPGDAGYWGFGSSPALGTKHVFVGGLDGKVYAFPQLSTQ